MISTRSLEVANVWRVTGGRWNAGARLHTKQPHLVTLCSLLGIHDNPAVPRGGAATTMPSIFVVCHQRFQCGAEQRRPGGGGGGIGGGVCRWSLRLCRGAVIKLVKCRTSGHFVLITGYNGHHHTLTWSAIHQAGTCTIFCTLSWIHDT